MTPEQRRLMSHVLVQFYDTADVAALTDTQITEEYTAMCRTGESQSLRPRVSVMDTPPGKPLKLKGCPFCTHTEIRVFKTAVLTGEGIDGVTVLWRVRCVHCCCHIDRETKRDAIAAWEQRA